MKYICRLLWYIATRLIILSVVAGLLILSHYRHQGQDRSIDWIDIFDRMFRNNMAVIGMLVVTFLLSLSITSVLTFDYGVAVDNNYSAILQPISLEYPFGTDNYGRCVFTRIVFGARISLVVGVCVTILPMVIGGILGAAAGYYSKRTDNIIMRLLDITNNEDIRKAILYSINQDEVVAVKNGLGGKCYTAMTMLKNDNDLIPDPNKVKEHLDNYFASLG